MPLGSHDLVQHLVLAFFSDQFLETIDDLVPSRHDCFDFVLSQVMLGFCGHFVRIQGLQLLE